MTKQLKIPNKNPNFTKKSNAFSKEGPLFNLAEAVKDFPPTAPDMFINLAQNETPRPKIRRWGAPSTFPLVIYL